MNIRQAAGCLLALVAFVVIATVMPKSGDAGVVQEVSRESTQVPVTNAKAGTLPASIEAKRDVTRQDFALNDVSPVFCGGEKYYKEKKCSKEYEESMVMTAVPLVFIAASTLFLWMIVLILRNCCTCFGFDRHSAGLCGGRYPTKGYCGGELKEADQGYSDLERKIFVFLLACILVVVAVGMAVGFSGNEMVSKGVSNLLDQAGDIPTRLQSKVIYPIQFELVALKALAARVNPYLEASRWENILKALAEVSQGADNMQVQVGDSLKVIRKYEADRDVYLYAGLWLPLILGILAFGGYYLPMLLTKVVLPLGVILTAVLFLTIGVHIPVSVATADFCVGLDHGLLYPNTSTPLDMIVGCHGEVGAKKMADSTRYFQETSSHVACSTLNQSLCGMPPVVYPDVHGNSVSFLPVRCPRMACNSATLGTFIKNTTVRDHMWGCAVLKNGKIMTKDCSFTDQNAATDHCLKSVGNTDTMPCLPNKAEAYREVSLQECNRTCLLNTTQAGASKVVGNADLRTRFMHLEKEQLLPLMDCTFIRQHAREIEKVLCWDVIDGTDYVTAGLCIIAVTLFVGNFVYLAAYKRFHRSYIESSDQWPGERDRILVSLGLQPEQPTQTTALLAGTETKAVESD